MRKKTHLSQAIVAPLVGAWIEIGTLPKGTEESTVAPLVGAWIEIIVSMIAI